MNSSSARSQRKQTYLSTDTRIQGCLKKASTKINNDRKARPPAWEPPNYSWPKGELDVVDGIGGLHVAVVIIGVLLLLGSNVDCRGRSGKTEKGENKAGEYLIYPRVLRPATKLLCMYQMERGRLYSGLQDRNTRVRGNMLGLSKTSIFRRCLAA